MTTEKQKWLRNYVDKKYHACLAGKRQWTKEETIVCVDNIGMWNANFTIYRWWYQMMTGFVNLQKRAFRHIPFPCSYWDNSCVLVQLSINLALGVMTSQTVERGTMSDLSMALLWWYHAAPTFLGARLSLHVYRLRSITGTTTIEITLHIMRLLFTKQNKILWMSEAIAYFSVESLSRAFG